MSDSAANFNHAIAECRRRLVREDRHRFALPGEPEPGFTRRRARAQTVGLCVACVALALVYLAIN